MLTQLLSSTSRLKVLQTLVKLSRPSGVRELEDLTGLRSRAVEQALAGLENCGALKKLADGRRKLALDAATLSGLKNVLLVLEEEEQKLKNRQFSAPFKDVLQLTDFGRKLNAEFTR